MSSQWLLLDNVLVRYVDDPDLYHHRVVLKGLEGRGRHDQAVVEQPVAVEQVWVVVYSST